MNCPRCGSAATGNFCASCGASLKPEVCPSCGAKPEPGDRFCNSCGSYLESRGQSPGPGGGNARIGWYAAGGVMVILILVMASPVLRGDRPPPAGIPAGTPAGAAPPVGTGTSSVDLASMTPRQAADRLFNRVMTAVSAGDSAQVQGFLPMAVAAYERAQPLDNDGVYHLALLQLTSLDFASALASAEAALADYPDHLLLLSAAAEAANRMGDSEAASGYYGRLLDVWDEQTALGLEEYQIHATMLPEIEASARSFLEGG